MIICDNCKEAYDLCCLSPPMHHLPRTPWYCSSCNQQRDKQSKLCDIDDDDGVGGDDDDSAIETSSNSTDNDDDTSDSEVETRQRRRKQPSRLFDCTHFLSHTLILENK